MWGRLGKRLLLPQFTPLPFHRVPSGASLRPVDEPLKSPGSHTTGTQIESVPFMNRTMEMRNPEIAAEVKRVSLKGKGEDRLHLCLSHCWTGWGRRTKPRSLTLLRCRWLWERAVGRATEGPSGQRVEGDFILNNDTALGSKEGVALGLQFQILGPLGAPWSPHPKPGERSPHGAQCQPTCLRTCHRQGRPKSLLLGPHPKPSEPASP